MENFFKTIFRRYQDKSSAKHNLDDFLKNAYSKQMKELNGTTGKRFKPSFRLFENRPLIPL